VPRELGAGARGRGGAAAPPPRAAACSPPPRVRASPHGRRALGEAGPTVGGRATGGGGGPPRPPQSAQPCRPYLPTRRSIYSARDGRTTPDTSIAPPNGGAARAGEERARSRKATGAFVAMRPGSRLRARSQTRVAAAGD